MFWNKYPLSTHLIQTKASSTVFTPSSFARFSISRTMKTVFYIFSTKNTHIPHRKSARETRINTFRDTFVSPSLLILLAYEFERPPLRHGFAGPYTFRPVTTRKENKMTRLIPSLPIMTFSSSYISGLKISVLSLQSTPYSEFSFSAT